MNAAEIMTKKVITVGPNMDIHKLASLFVKKNISGAPVVDSKGKYLGVVLEESLIFQDKKVHLPTFVSILSGFIMFGEDKFKNEIEKISATTVRGIMEVNAKTIAPGVNVEDVATMMIENNIHYFPVIDAGRLIGVVTKKDIVKAIAKGKI